MEVILDSKFKIEEEIRRLQRENEDLKEEKEILKKALAIFSKHPK